MSQALEMRRHSRSEHGKLSKQNYSEVWQSQPAGCPRLPSYEPETRPVYLYSLTTLIPFPGISHDDPDHTYSEESCCWLESAACQAIAISSLRRSLRTTNHGGSSRYSGQHWRVQGQGEADGSKKCKHHGSESCGRSGEDIAGSSRHGKSFPKKPVPARSRSNAT